MSDDLQIKIAQPDDFEKIGEVFDLYRQFYKKESNVEACKNYIKERLSNKEAQIFYIENEKDGKTYIKGLGQLDDQINNKFWFIPVRKSDQDAGVGKINFIDVPNNYNFLLKSNCNYAINYFENRSFFKD